MPKRPWNRIDTPVYSLVTKNNEQCNMNICTYVTAVSMQPKRFMVAVYHNTQSLLNMQNADECVLQYLSAEQYIIVNALGKKSGATYNKINYLRKKNMLTQWNGFEVLENAVAWIHLKKINVTPAGDHDMYLYDMLAYKSNNEMPILTLQMLIDKKIILG